MEVQTNQLERDEKFFRLYLKYWSRGEMVAAYQVLHDAQAGGSQVCRALYAEALVKGAVPGKMAEPSAVLILKQVVQETNALHGAQQLGHLLLSGKYVTQNITEGLNLLARSAVRNYQIYRNSVPALDLAAIYYSGAFGVNPSKEKSIYWAMLGASRLRIFLHRFGMSQHSWALGQLNLHIKKNLSFKKMDYWQTVKHIKNRVESIYG